jgi:hypothetical protein
MKKRKDRLSNKQFQILIKSAKDMNTTQQWMCEQGFNNQCFNQTDELTLKAQKVATVLLKEHKSVLSEKQIEKLQTFKLLARKQAQTNKLKIASVYEVLNIGTKINRQLFKLNRQA